MSHSNKSRLFTAIALSALLGLGLASCTKQPLRKAVNNKTESPPTNRIDVPDSVRKNLGIAFIKAERRNVATTLRLPAIVELLPSATQHYRAPLTGRISLHVEPLQKVKAGDLLYTLDSHEWRNLQRELGNNSNKLAITKAQLAAMGPLSQACQEHEASLREAHQIITSYIETLRQAEQNVGGQGEKLKNARIDQAKLLSQIAEASEKHTETETRVKELTAMVSSQREHVDLLISGAAATLAVDESVLTQQSNSEMGWRLLNTIEIRAKQEGIVDQITAANGNLVETYGAVVITIDPSKVRCHAKALQSDLSQLRDGLTADIVPIGAVDQNARVSATIQLGPTGDARLRTLEVFATPTATNLRFMRPGQAVFVEITTTTSEKRELAIPKSCVLPDGLEHVFFRRDPKNQDKVIRIVGDFGQHNGQWIEVLSGIKDGDEIVAAGAFELVLASSDSTPKGGHFHADGTWHAGSEDH